MSPNEEVIPEVIPQRIHVEEFLARYPELSVLWKAGFKAYAKKVWMYPEEWAEILKAYNRGN